MGVEHARAAWGRVQSAAKCRATYIFRKTWGGELRYHLSYKLHHLGSFVIVDSTSIVSDSPKTTNDDLSFQHFCASI